MDIEHGKEREPLDDLKDNIRRFCVLKEEIKVTESKLKELKEEYEKLKDEIKSN